MTIRRYELEASVRLPDDTIGRVVGIVDGDEIEVNQPDLANRIVGTPLVGPGPHYLIAHGPNLDTHTIHPESELGRE